MVLKFGLILGICLFGIGQLSVVYGQGISSQRLGKGIGMLSSFCDSSNNTKGIDRPDGSTVGTVVDNFVVPIPEPSGLCTDGSSLWIPNYALASGPQRIYKMNIWTHQIVDSIRAPGTWMAGIAWDGSNLWALTDYPTYQDFSLVRLSSSGGISVHYPAVYSCYWSGIAWDGRSIYYGNNVCGTSPVGQKSMIYKLNPNTGAIIDSIHSPTGSVNGIVYDRGHLWYCDDYYKYIFEIDTTGNILREFPSYGGLLSGLTIAKGYLWAVDMAGIGGCRVYEIDIGLAPPIPSGPVYFPGVVGAIKFIWQPTVDSELKAYRIYRSNSDELTNAQLIDSVAGTVTTYIDSTVPHGMPFYYWISAVDSDGIESYPYSIGEASALPYLSFRLSQNYPNPFNASTTIAYEVPLNGESFNKTTTHVSINVYDILGRKMATLVDAELGPGDKSVVFNAGNLPSGVYFCRMQTAKFISARKMLLVK
ncbi:MAG TPA: T9SS type A sorting domain-containing protein [Candidatus Kryptonia bacterium]